MAKEEGSEKGVTFPQAIRDVLIASMDKGLLIPTTLAIVLIIFAWRMPPSDITKVGFEVIKHLRDYSLLGWALFFVVVVVWGVHANWMNRVLKGETERVIGERNRLQEAGVGKKLKSSN